MREIVLGESKMRQSKDYIIILSALFAAPASTERCTLNQKLPLKTPSYFPTQFSHLTTRCLFKVSYFQKSTYRISLVLPLPCGKRSYGGSFSRHWLYKEKRFHSIPSSFVFRRFTLRENTQMVLWIVVMFQDVLSPVLYPPPSRHTLLDWKAFILAFCLNKT